MFFSVPVQRNACHAVYTGMTLDLLSEMQFSRIMTVNLRAMYSEMCGPSVETQTLLFSFFWKTKLYTYEAL